MKKIDSSSKRIPARRGRRNDLKKTLRMYRVAPGSVSAHGHGEEVWDDGTVRALRPTRDPGIRHEFDSCRTPRVRSGPRYLAAVPRGRISVLRRDLRTVHPIIQGDGGHPQPRTDALILSAVRTDVGLHIPGQRRVLRVRHPATGTDLGGSVVGHVSSPRTARTWPRSSASPRAGVR